MNREAALDATTVYGLFATVPPATNHELAALLAVAKAAKDMPRKYRSPTLNIAIDAWKGEFKGMTHREALERIAAMDTSSDHGSLFAAVRIAKAALGLPAGPPATGDPDQATEAVLPALEKKLGIRK